MLIKRTNQIAYKTQKKGLKSSTKKEKDNQNNKAKTNIPKNATITPMWPPPATTKDDDPPLA